MTNYYAQGAESLQIQLREAYGKAESLQNTVTEQLQKIQVCGRNKYLDYATLGGNASVVVFDGVVSFPHLVLLLKSPHFPGFAEVTGAKSC